MIWVIVGSVVLLCMVAILLLPVAVEVNSEKEVYRAGVKGLLYIQLLPERDGWKGLLRAGWWKREFRISLPGKGKPEAKKPGKKTRRFRPATVWRKGRRLLASFRVRRFRLILDTDDFILNAYLYPIFVFLSGRNRLMAINFQGRTSVDILVTNRVWRVVWALIR